MHWYDWVGLATLVVVTVVQTVRGTKMGIGLVLFEAAALIVAAVGATAIGGPLAELIHVQKAVAIIITFLLFGILGFIVAHWFYALLPWSSESLDGFLSLFCGLAAGWTIAHMVLRIIIESQGPNGEVASMVANSVIVRELYGFHTWNAILRLLFRAKLGPEINPDQG